MVETNVRYTICDVIKTVGKSLLRVHFILKPILKDFYQMDTTFIDRWPKTDTSISLNATAKINSKLNQSNKKKGKLNMAN